MEYPHHPASAVFGDVKPKIQEVAFHISRKNPYNADRQLPLLCLIAAFYSRVYLFNVYPYPFMVAICLGCLDKDNLAIVFVSNCR